MQQKKLSKQKKTKENRYNIIKFLTTFTASKCLLKSFRHMVLFPALVQVLGYVCICTDMLTHTLKSRFLYLKRTLQMPLCQ